MRYFVPLLTFTACMLIADPTAGVAAQAAARKVYAIETLHIDSNNATRLPDYLRQMRTFHERRHVELVAAYQVQFGSDTGKVVAIWSAPDAEALRQALGSRDAFKPALRQIIQSDVIEIAEANPVESLERSSASPSNKVYALVTLAIDPSRHEEFVAELRHEPAIEGKQGVSFVASYHVQLGDTAREVDIWSAPDPQTIRRSFFSTAPAAGDFSEIKRASAELVELIKLD